MYSMRMVEPRTYLEETDEAVAIRQDTTVFVNAILEIAKQEKPYLLTREFYKLVRALSYMNTYHPGKYLVDFAAVRPRIYSTQALKLLSEISSENIDNGNFGSPPWKSLFERLKQEFRIERQKRIK